MTYAAAQQPYITEVYANNDQSTSGGYMAVEIYNPYSTPISLTNWQWATVSRPASASQLVVKGLTGGPTDLSTLVPTLARISTRYS